MVGCASRVSGLVLSRGGVEKLANGRAGVAAGAEALKGGNRGSVDGPGSNFVRRREGWRSGGSAF
jgi:hypothetical protein